MKTAGEERSDEPAVFMPERKREEKSPLRSLRIIQADLPADCLILSLTTMAPAMDIRNKPA